jgi:Pyruvate/2-oxoacid:ferredoxin oxidoreductase gamma subunit
LEALRETEKSGKQTKFLVNDYSLPFLGSLPAEEIKKQLSAIKNEIYIIPASANCKEKLQNEIVCTLYSLGYAVAKNLIPLKKESVLKAIEQRVPEKYKELNIKAFELGYVS